MKDLNEENETYFKEQREYDPLLKKLCQRIIELNNDPKIIAAIEEEEEEQKVLNSYYDLGIAEGIKQNKIEIAKKMLKDELDMETIIKYTNLSKAELDKL